MALVVPLELSAVQAIILLVPLGPILLSLGPREKRRRRAFVRGILTRNSIRAILLGEPGVLDDVLLVVDDVPVLHLVAYI